MPHEVFKDKDQPRNTAIEDIKDVPEQEVKRLDGLPTKQDLERLLGKSVSSEETSDKESQSPSDIEKGRTMISIQLSDDVSPEDLADFIKKIMNIGQ